MEPLRRTLFRTVTLALIAGAILASQWGGMRRWPLATLSALWFSFGGHWVELGYLRLLRPRLPAGRAVQFCARVGAWFLGGTALGLGAIRTAMLFGEWQHTQRPAWWLGGVVLVALELVVHLALQARGQPNAYNGRG